MMICDLPRDLVGEILSRVPIKSMRAVRSTCKQWNALTKDHNFTDKHCAEASKEFLMMMMTYDSLDRFTRVGLFGIHNNKDNLLRRLSMKQLGGVKQGDICEVLFYCDGLLLCTIRYNNNNVELVVWNPYLGQVRRIETKEVFSRFDVCTIGYDNNRNHKIWMCSGGYLSYAKRGGAKNEIYDFKSGLWRALDAPLPLVSFYRGGVSLKGNTYFVASDDETELGGAFLHSFDFTGEILGPRMLLPFRSCPQDSVILSTVAEEKLAVLFKSYSACDVEIWVTSKVDPNAVSWTKFLKVDDIPYIWRFKYMLGSFLVLEKNKVAVLCDKDRVKVTKTGKRAYFNLNYFNRAFSYLN